ncbi:MAG: OB-fold domain-containing protein [Actinomycetota bacterium]
MTAEQTQIPAIEGWFTTAPPALVGTQCRACGSYFFPPERVLCRNPACTSTDLEETELSTRGKVWSFSVNHYAAPEPYVGKEPFEAYTVVAVELSRERMVVLGQLAEGADPAALRIGDEVEVSIEPLFTDAEGRKHLVWKWRPVQ